MLQVYSKMRKIFESVTALLSNRSNLPWNQLAVYAEGPGQFVYQIALEMDQHWCGRTERQLYALRVAEPVHRWFLGRPKDLAFIGLLLFEDCVLEVDLFPDLGGSIVARDVPGNDVVIGRGRSVLIKRSNSASKHGDLDYGRGREACNRSEVSMKAEYIWCNPNLLWGIRSHPQRGDHGAHDHARWRHTSDLSAVG
jgi:hypothetical protein